MKIALLGYGKMGQLVEQAAERDGNDVVAIVDPASGSRGSISDAEVCIDFTEPGAVIENIKAAAAARICRECQDSIIIWVPPVPSVGSFVRDDP